MPNQSPAVASAAVIEHARPRRLFVTGANGYVGRNLIRLLVEKDVEIVALVRTADAGERVRALGAIPVVGDIFSDALVDFMRGSDALVHAAADTDHGHGGPQQMRTNADGTKAVFSAARLAGIQRAIHVSTESVLSDGRPLRMVDETMPYPHRPAGSYSRSKIAAERNALSLNGTGFTVMAVRPRFVWGQDDTTALPALVRAARSGQMAWIDGGGYLTSTTHIDNLCHGIDLALRYGRGGEAYFLSDGEPVAFRTFVTALLDTQGVTPPDKTIPRHLLRLIAAVGDLVGTASGRRKHVPLTLQGFAASAVEVTLDISKARTALGYSPVRSMPEGLQMLRSQTVNNLQS